MKSIGNKIKSRVTVQKISLKNINTYDKRPLNVSMNINKLKKKIYFNMQTISNVSRKMVKINNVKYKNFKRR